MRQKLLNWKLGALTGKPRAIQGKDFEAKLKFIAPKGGRTGRRPV